ncbi:MAG: hypothetical protein G01um101418_844 [Parcubacteria group bacterium Gr01-1014_18]|nr:MAG: hypothetical protein Greene041636_804 [Parcubacteria group bacterium Greene0416_36]TSC79845.1 MAG: hypothetical protein G01um101418_844 [Parcubacteria group bacterium Gr01-1014_18]TSC98277.1 MAG: hypothetical protein Greene101420_781 [Parcubacteria group bacterium Greene1014_20]TSD06683.1 MAG: hypothetical protein Greene07142_735 [Parcubacteria group bacterium Greene0714_2]
MLDINNHLIKEADLDMSENLQGTFQILADNKILPESFADRIAQTVGLRNRLVHRYEEIDKPRFIRDFRREMGDFEEYLRIIAKYVEKSESGKK